MVAVLAYHARLPLESGYLGVDIFFAISGFVVFGMLWEEFAETGALDLKRFFLRRFLRLAPALAVVVSVTVLALLLFSMPGLPLFDQAAQTGLGALTLSANLVISQISGGYFGEAPENNPLLHTWSLSVEEQFYLGGALALFLFLRLTGSTSSQKQKALLIGAVALATMMSFFSQFVPSWFDFSVGLGFYSPATRAWEFLAGAGAYLISRNWNRERTRWLPVVGLLGITAALFGAVENPYLARLLVTSGTVAVLIPTNRLSLVTNFLESKIAVAIGNISYPLYLWHWPVLFLANLLFPGSAAFVVLGVVISLTLAYLSHRYLEIPLKRPVSNSRTTLIRFMGFGLAPLLIVGSLSALSPLQESIGQKMGVWEVAHPGATGHEDFHLAYEEAFSPCERDEILQQAPVWRSHIRCYQSSLSTPPTVALVGDSHAETLFYGLASVSPDNFVYFIQNALPVPSSGPQFAKILQYVENSEEIETVIISAWWAGRGIPEEELGAELSRLVEAGKRVFITDDNPSFSTRAEVCKFEVVLSSRDSENDCVSPRNSADGVSEARAIQALADSIPGVAIIRTYEEFCEQDVCSMLSDSGDLLYRDKNHLNLEGSLLISGVIFEAIGHHN